MDLYARVNILGGLSVRLPRGRFDDAIALDNDPIRRARHWAEQGVDYMHIVDLDAAAYGDYRNRELIDRLIDEVPVPVQVAGGIRSEGEAQRLIEKGAWRIVMGTAAIENQNMVWDLCRENPDKIAVSVDVRSDEEIVTKGWTQNSGRYLEEVLIEMSSAGVVSFLVSEAGRDALEDPPNFQIMAEALATVEQPVIAAGGVRDLEDLRNLVRLEAAGRNLDGVVVGREVTVGRFTIEEAKQVLAGVGPTRAPGGVVATTVRVGVTSLQKSLDFYRRARLHPCPHPDARGRGRGDRIGEGTEDRAGRGSGSARSPHLRCRRPRAMGPASEQPRSPHERRGQGHRDRRPRRARPSI